MTLNRWGHVSVLCCLKRTWWDSLEFSTFSETSQWWSVEGRHDGPLTWLQSWQTSSDTHIRAAVCITSLKEASRLTQWPQVPVLDGCGSREFAVLPLGEELLIGPRKTPRYFPIVTAGFPEQSSGLKSAGDFHCWSLFEFMPCGALQANSSTMVQLGETSKPTKQKRHRKDTWSVVILTTHHDVYCSRTSNGKQGKDYSQSK